MHLAYHLDFKRWQATKEFHVVFKTTKEKFQKEFRERLGFLVDMPKTGGTGTSNDGSTSRRAFENADIFSEITSIDIELIKRLPFIFIMINSNYSILTELFRQYCLDTAKLFVYLYPWFFMPASLHKILIIK